MAQVLYLIPLRGQEKQGEDRSSAQSLWTQPLRRPHLWKTTPGKHRQELSSQSCVVGLFPVAKEDKRTTTQT
ncbi:hypothetical protein SRHO_G00229990 [Serrasalmus rhombeus]